MVAGAGTGVGWGGWGSLDWKDKGENQNKREKKTKISFLVPVCCHFEKRGTSRSDRDMMVGQYLLCPSVFCSRSHSQNACMTPSALSLLVPVLKMKALRLKEAE